MIQYKTKDDIAVMRKSCLLAAKVLSYIEPFVKPGVTTNELNDLCHEFIVKNKAIPSPLNYKGFPKSICTSVNEEVCHGIPSKRVLKEGDIVKVDVTCYLNSFHGDTCATFSVGKTSRAARDLVAATEEALWAGIRAIKNGGHVGDIGAAIQELVEGRGYSVVREYCGHGIGRNFHEDPAIVHYGKRGTGPQLKTGMVFTVEPMINMGRADIVLLEDNWTVETKDRKLSAQFEHTVAVLEDHVEVLTLPEESKYERLIKMP